MLAPAGTSRPSDVADCDAIARLVLPKRADATRSRLEPVTVSRPGATNVVGEIALTCGAGAGDGVGDGVGEGEGEGDGDGDGDGDGEGDGDGDGEGAGTVVAGAGDDPPPQPVTRTAVETQAVRSNRMADTIYFLLRKLRLTPSLRLICQVRAMVLRMRRPVPRPQVVAETPCVILAFINN